MPQSQNPYFRLDQVPETERPDFSTPPQDTSVSTLSEGSPYRKLEQANRQTETQMRLVQDAKQGTNPDQHADTMRIASASGLPVEVVERDYAKLKTQYPPEPVNYKDIVDRTPHLARWLTDPNNAKLLKEGQGELEHMGALEWIFTAPGRAVSSEMNRANYSELRAKQMLGATLTQGETDAMNSYKYHADRDGDLGVKDSFFAKAWTGLYKLAAQAGPGAGYGVAGAAIGGAGGWFVGGPPGMWQGARTGGRLGIAYGTVKSSAILESVETYDELLAMKDETGKPIDPDVARAAAMAVGGLNGMIELTGVGIFMERFPGLDKLTAGGGRAAMKAALLNPTVRGALGRMVKSYASGVAGETAQEVAQDAIAITAQELAKFASGESFDKQRKGAGDVWNQLVDTVAQSIPEFAFGMAPGPVMQFKKDVDTARRAESSVQFFTALGEATKNSGVATRMPAAFQRFVEDASEPVKTLYQDADSWVAYWQSKKMNPAEVAQEVTGDANALDKAMQTGQLAIPTAKYATTLAGTEHNAYFVNELRVGPDEMNGREAEEFKERAAAVKERIAEEARKARESPEEAALSEIRTGVIGQLGKIGVSRETAAPIAEFVAGIGNLVQRAGFDAKEVYGIYGLEAKRATAPTVATPGEGAAPTILHQGPPGTPPATPAPGATPAGELPATAPLGDEAIPGLAELEASVGDATIEHLDPEEGLMNNASGESAVSGEAMKRLRDMNKAGRQFVVYDRAGRMRPITGADAIDYRPMKGETFGIQTPQGFEVHTDNGGRVPADGGVQSALGRNITTLFQGPAPLQAVPAGQRVDGEPGATNANGERATFIGYQPGYKSMPTHALYNIEGGERDGSTVGGEALAQMGIPIPPTPPLLEYNKNILAASTPLQQWFGKSVVVDESGKPLVVYHGTTHIFTTFDSERGTVEADFGRGFYFSNNAADVGENYATVGPDLAGKIERDAEILQQTEELYDRELDMETARQQARAKYVQQEGLTMPVFLKMERPAELGGDNPTTLTLEIVEDEEGDIIEEKGTMLDFIVALRDAAASFHDGSVEPAIQKMIEHGDELTLADAITFIKESEHASYYTDDDGNLAQGEVIRAALERAGYDGIIDRTVDIKFGSQKRVGKAMAGMDEDTVHYIVFQPTQIKSAVGNRGTFDPTSPNILYQSALEPAPAQQIYYSKLAKVLDESKRGAGTGKEWKTEILKAKIGVNKDEFAIARMQDLKDDVRYDRASVIEHFKLNNPLAGFVVLGDPNVTHGVPVMGARDNDDRELDPDALNDEIEEVEQEYENDAYRNFDDWDDIVGRATTLEDDTFEEEITEDVPAVDEAGNVLLTDAETGEPLMTTVTRKVTRTVYYAAVEGGYAHHQAEGESWGRTRSRSGTDEISSIPYDTEEEAERVAEDWLRAEREEEWASEKLGEYIRDGLDYSDIHSEAERRLRRAGTGWLDDDGSDEAPTGEMKQVVPPTQYGDYILQPDPETGSYREGFITAGNVEESTHVVGPTKKELALAMFGAGKFDTLNPIQKEMVNTAHAQNQKPKTFKWDWRDGHDKYSNIKNPIVRIRWSVRETIGEPLPLAPAPVLSADDQALIKKGRDASAKIETMRWSALARRREAMREAMRENPQTGELERQYTDQQIEDQAGTHLPPEVARDYFDARERDEYYDLKAERGEGDDIERRYNSAVKESQTQRYAKGKRVLFLEEVQPPQPKQQPNMPPIFVRNWRDIAFKFALHYAVEHDFDTVAWTTGQQQADFWNLEKQVQSIVANVVTVNEKAQVKEPTTLGEGESFELIHEEPPAAAKPHPFPWSKIEADEVQYEATGTDRGAKVAKEHGLVKRVDITLTNGEQIVLDVNKEGTAVFVKTSDIGVRDRMTGQPLGEIVGQELAARIMDHVDPEKSLLLSGKGLRVGGEGLKALYEYDFINTVKDIPAFKQHGGTTGTVKMESKVDWNVELPTGVHDEQLAKQGLTRETPESVFVSDNSGKVIKQFSGGTVEENRQDAAAYVHDNEYIHGDQPAVFLTPEVAAAVAGGSSFLQSARYRPVSGVELDVMTQQVEAVVQAAAATAPPGVALNASVNVTGELVVNDLRTPAGDAAAAAPTLQAVLDYADEQNMQVALPDSVAGPAGTSRWNFFNRLGFIANGAAGFYDAASAGSLVRPSKEQRAKLQQGGKKQEEEKPRGAITWDRNRKMTISLFEHADLSTFLHEVGHFYLEVFGDLVDKLDALDPATLTPSQLKVKADYALLLQHIGVDHRNQIEKKHHELFARSFETYLMEGKAPSLQLREAFSRVRAWFLGIYRSLKALNAPLTPEVRKVFDRMLATDAAIAEAESAGELNPMWLTPEEASMSHEAFALYRKDIEDASRQGTEELEAKHLAEVHREQQAQYRERKAEVRKQVEAQTHAMPVYKAMAAMQRGLQPDGSPLAVGLLPGEAGEPVPMKLSKKMIVEQFGAAILTKLPKTIYSAEGGVAPGVVAHMFGFDSGDALLVAVADAKPMRRHISQETDRRMLEEEPPMMLDGSIHEAAQRAVANEMREAVLKDELRALAKKKADVRAFEQGVEKRMRAEANYERRWLEAEAKLRIAIAEGRKQVEIDELQRKVSAAKALARSGPATIRGAIPSSRVLADQAKASVAGTKVSDLNPMLYWSNMRRASKLATEAAARQDFDEAIRQKHREFISLALYRATINAKQEVEKRVKAARKVAEPKSMARLMLAGRSFHDQVAGVLDRFEFAEVPQDALDRRASLAKWILGQEAQGLPLDLPDDIVDEARRTNYKNLTVEELVGVTDGLKQLVFSARAQNRLLKNARTANLNTLAATLDTSIRANKAAKPRGRRDRTSGVERGRMARSFMASHRKLASLLREIDGFIDGGPMWEAIMRPLNDAAAREAVMNADATKTLHELLKKAYPTKERSRLYAKTFIPAINQSLSKMERLMIALNYGNEGNRDRIQRYEKWTPQQVQAVLDTLDARDAEFVQGVFDFINSYWTEIAEKQERVFGHRPEKVEASPFTIGSVQMKGGYFPLKYDDRLSARASTMIDLEQANLAKGAAVVQATTKRGHTKARTESLGEPVRYDFGVIDEHIMQVIHDLSHHEALIDIGRILAHHDVQKAIMETHGDITYKAIKNSVRDAAVGHIPGGTWFERSLNHTRIGVTIVGLAWSLTTPLMQLLGFANSTQRLRPKWMAKGMLRSLGMGTPRSMIGHAKWVHEVSPFMRTRHLTQQRELNEIRNEVGVYSGKFTGWIEEALARTTFDIATKQGVMNTYFAAISIMQKMVDIPTWSGAYEKAMSDGGAAEGDHERAVAIADQAVLDTQSGGSIKDLAEVQRGTPALKIFTNFYTAGNALFNQAVEIGVATNLRSPASIGLMLVDYMTIFTIPAVMGYYIRQALKPGDDDDDDKLAKNLAIENLVYLMGTMVGVRELTGAVQDFYGYDGPAGARIFASTNRLIKQVAQGEVDEALLRSLNEVAGIILHYPANQVWKTANGMAALAEGRETNPLVLLTGPEKK